GAERRRDGDRLGIAGKQQGESDPGHGKPRPHGEKVTAARMTTCRTTRRSAIGSRRGSAGRGRRHWAASSSCSASGASRSSSSSLALPGSASPPFSGLDTLPSIGVVALSLGFLLEDAVLAAIGLGIGALGTVVVIGLGSLVVTWLRGLFS